MTLLGELAEDWPRLNRLLDEALSLPEPERQRWLHALPAEHAALKDTLARLLAVRAEIETGDFLGTLPKLDDRAPASGGEIDAGVAAPGDEVGPWRLLRELGAGGMGSVWLAERADGQLKRQVALKLPRLAWARGLAERMARERDILATLEHPHIARLYDAGIDRLGRPWLALEVVHGEPIDVYASTRALTVRQRVELLLQVCAAVAFAHSRLVIHRDLKPSNILVTDAGQVRLLDFGIAKLIDPDETRGTAVTELAGRALTLRFASPEQVRGDVLGTASDVYSLGVVAYELLSGASPYRLQRGTAAELEEAIQAADIALASQAAADPARRRALRGDLDAILHRALQRLPQQRLPSVADFAADLQRHLDGRPVASRRATWRYLGTRWVQRHRLEASVAVGVGLMALGGAYTQLAVGLALGTGTLAALWQARRSRQAARHAQQESQRADAMQRFVLDLFRANSLNQPDPLKAQATPASELLALGAQRLLQGEGGAPAQRARLLDDVFALVQPLQMTALAEQMARQRLALRAGLDGPAADTTLQARADLCEALLVVPEKLGEAIEQAERVIATLQQSGRGDSLLRARVERLLSKARVSTDAPGSLQHIERAVARYEQLQPRSLGWAEACIDAVMPLTRVERNRDAERLASAAVAVLRQLGADDELARGLVELGEVQSLLRDHEAAQAAFAEALALRERRLGPGHGSTIFTLCKQATALRVIGRWRDAEAAASLGIRRCVEFLGADETHYQAMLRVERGRCLVLLGRLADASAELNAALDCLKAWGARNFGHAAVLLAQATAACGLGDLDRADAHLDDLETLLGELGFAPGSVNHDFAHLLRADVALRRGDADAAEHALAQVRHDVTTPDGSMPTRQPRSLGIQAEMARLRGDLPAARQAIDRALQAAQASTASASTPGVVAALHETHARVLQACGQGADARAAAARAVALRQAHEADDSVPLAQARALQARVAGGG